MDFTNKYFAHHTYHNCGQVHTIDFDAAERQALKEAERALREAIEGL
jgi:hypothetical protein